MTLHSLAEIAAKIGRLDGFEEDKQPQFLIALRNLTARSYLPPTKQEGRSFLYDAPAAVTIRLAQIASEFGLSRADLDTLARWLSNSGTRREKVKGGFIGLSHAAEAIERAEAGEVFGIHVIMRADRSVFIAADWTPDNEPRPKVRQAAADAGVINTSPEIARFSMPAARLIAEFLPALKG